MGDWALYGAAFAFGIGSALLPIFLNAEAYVIAMGALVSTRFSLLLGILFLVAGTILGKAVVFELARKGSNRIRSVDRKRSPNEFLIKVRRFSDWLLSLLDQPYAGALTALMSSLFGVPPLAIVTIMAGASKQKRWIFLLMVFIGRLLQFLVLAFIVHKAT